MEEIVTFEKLSLYHEWNLDWALLAWWGSQNMKMERSRCLASGERAFANSNQGPLRCHNAGCCVSPANLNEDGGS